MRRIRPICSIVVVTISFALVGCGGDESEGAPGSGDGSTVAASGVGDAFAGQAVEVCNRALEDKRAWAQFPVADFNPTAPDVSVFPEVSAWLEDEVAPTFQAWLEGLEELGAPPSGQDAWDDVLSAVERIGRLNAEQITAADDADPEAFATATADLGTAQDDLVAATDAAGVPECAEPHAA